MVKKKKSRRKTSTGSDSKGACFIITPFGGWFDDYYETIYKPAIEAAGLVATRADDLYRPGTIVNDIWRFTREAKVVLADLTQKNPNVFYELGLAHALAKPAILITEAVEDVPFDLRSLRVLQYDKNRPDWGEELKTDITNAIEEVLKAPQEAVLPTFLRVKPDKKTLTLTEGEKAIMQIRQEIDALRREVISSRIGTPEIIIGPGQAEEMIDDFLRRGYSASTILRRLVSWGVPKDWGEKKIREIMKEMKQPPLPFVEEKGSK